MLQCCLTSFSLSCPLAFILFPLLPSAHTTLYSYSPRHIPLPSTIPRYKSRSSIPSAADTLAACTSSAACSILEYDWRDSHLVRTPTSLTMIRCGYALTQQPLPVGLNWRIMYRQCDQQQCRSEWD
ncbi:hypothetical protein P280DRAFT_464474 [Massarina eburnea CBS 473.64]|uniref:Secreted protein n=1 Tax=Massarina eburnea CBS 473.64 TaxID=1395130 RepID=A0A6A6SGS5_9PLEO|nr:hypothetical protein P280DRAFT_464474 [Massarina eburnea CBS 473.64]